MKQIIRSALVLAGAAGIAAARQPAEPNPMVVIVANGPYAGTYTARADEVVCLHAKAQKMYAASFKDFEAKGPRTFAEGGMKVDNPDAPGPKTGDLLASFGPNDKHAVEYNVIHVPVTLTMKGKGAELTGTGKTKDGVQIQVKESCVEVTTM